MAAARPNIILIIMDDLCWGDLGCHGNPHTRTPNLDKLHGQSTRFTRYCSGPLCSPARASLMTGRYHPRTKVLDTYCGRSMIAADEPGMAKSLRAAGYRTGAFGKWHLGDTHPCRAIDQGFDETYQHLGGGIGQPGDHWENYARPEDCYFDPILFRNGKPEPSSGYCTDIFAEETIRFVRENKDQPFFAYLATNAPHSPLLIADEWADTYRNMGINEMHSRLYGMVENIDMNVGRIMDELDELDLAADTILIYTSDHGPCASARDYNAPPGEGHRFNAGLRGTKGSLYEGGIRVPNFWRWPGRFREGMDVDRVTHPIDALPTLLSLCGAEMPTGHTIDGEDLTPLLTHETAPEAWPERKVYMQWHRGDTPVRYRNCAVITQTHKYIRPDERQDDELYCLADDPFETTDLAGTETELLDGLRADYDAWLDEMAATRGRTTFDPPRLSVGVPEENPAVLNHNDRRLFEGEGWNRDELRGYWDVNVADEGSYTIRVRFRQQVAAGKTFFRLEDMELSTTDGADGPVATFTGVRLRTGPARVEAWREATDPQPDASFHRYIPGMWVEFEREGLQN